MRVGSQGPKDLLGCKSFKCVAIGEIFTLIKLHCNSQIFFSGEKHNIQFTSTNYKAKYKEHLQSTIFKLPCMPFDCVRLANEMAMKEVHQKIRDVQKENDELVAKLAKRDRECEVKSEEKVFVIFASSTQIYSSIEMFCPFKPE